MNDEVVLWKGELRVRLSSIEAIRHDIGTVFLKSGQRFKCDNVSDRKILKEIELKMLPTTEGHDWQVDANKTLADLKAGMPEILPDNSYRGGRVLNDDIMVMYWREVVTPARRRFGI